MPKAESNFQKETNQLHLDNLPRRKMNQNMRLTVQRDTSRRLVTMPDWAWQYWAVLMVIVFGGIGFTATSWLLKLPKVANCPRVFWPMASASMRLYCAQIQAEKNTVEDLLQAIELVEWLPQDHPLHSEIERNVEEWAAGILNLAETSFQEGNLEEAIAIAEQMPSKVQAYQLVAERIDKWRSLWSKAEKIDEEVERELRLSNWTAAFRAAVKLTEIDNEYWATERYEKVVSKIQTAREESSRLDAAYAALRRGKLGDLIQAVEQALTIGPESYAYKEAQDLIDDARNEILKQADTLVENRNWQELLLLAGQIPDSLDIRDRVRDWNQIASAGSDADLGTVGGLEQAIAQAKNIEPTSSVYDKAQLLLDRWNKEVEDVAKLTKARDLAQIGSISNLTAAIAEVELIPQFNPRYEEARKEIQSWREQIQIIEDRPLLNRAREWAMGGTVGAWQEAINQASAIAPNRALYREAQSEIGKWRANIEREEDRPILDRAESLANNYDFAAAIATAAEIQRGRALYNEAQQKARNWRSEITARENLDRADSLAREGTPESLAKALWLVRQIPKWTTVANQRLDRINDWSQELLRLAEAKANYSLAEAIEIAQKIPSGTFAYTSARKQIASWQQMLQPPKIEPSPEPQAPIQPVPTSSDPENNN